MTMEDCKKVKEKFVLLKLLETNLRHFCAFSSERTNVRHFAMIVLLLCHRKRVSRIFLI